MTKYEELVSEVAESEIDYFDTDSESVTSQCIRIRDKYAIFFNESAFDTTAERRVALAHEKAHCDTGALYSVFAPLFQIERYEKRAWKRTINDVIPFDEKFTREFERCIYADGLDIYELADRLDVTVEFAKRAIEYYHENGERW
jgi:hypothetical protein